MQAYGYCCCCRCGTICGYTPAVCDKAVDGEETKCYEGKGTWCGGQFTLSGDAIVKRINDQNYGTAPAGFCRWSVRGTGRAVWMGPMQCRLPVPNTYVLGGETGWYEDGAPYTITMPYSGNASSDWGQYVGVANGPGIYLRYRPGLQPQVAACTIDGDGSASITSG